jgi:hypothetical protein
MRFDKVAPNDHIIVEENYTVAKAHQYCGISGTSGAEPVLWLPVISTGEIEPKRIDQSARVSNRPVVDNHDLESAAGTLVV